MSTTSTATAAMSWKMQHRPGSWRAAAAPSPSIQHTPGREGPVFHFERFPYDVQEYVLRYLPIVDLVRARAVSAAFIIIYEGVACTEFVALANAPKPKFGRVSDEFQFLYRSRRLDDPTHVTPLLLWAAARDHHVLIKHILQRSIGSPVARGPEASPANEEDVALLLAAADAATAAGLNSGNNVGGAFGSDARLGRLLSQDETESDAEIMSMDYLRGPNGITPLHVACRNDHVQSTMELIKAGGDVLARDHKSQTPFYHACALGQGPALVVVRTIIKHCHFLRSVVAARRERESYDPTTHEQSRVRDIDLNMVSQEGKTCLYAAAERGHPGKKKKRKKKIFKFFITLLLSDSI